MGIVWNPIIDTEYNITNTPITNGQFMVESDQGNNGKIYVDFENQRIRVGGTVDIDSQLSTSSTNPVQNKVVTNALNTKVNYSDIQNNLNTVLTTTSNVVPVGAKAIQALNETIKGLGNKDIYNGGFYKLATTTDYSGRGLKAALDNICYHNISSYPNKTHIYNILLTVLGIGEAKLDWTLVGNVVQGSVSCNGVMYHYYNTNITTQGADSVLKKLGSGLELISGGTIDFPSMTNVAISIDTSVPISPTDTVDNFLFTIERVQQDGAQGENNKMRCYMEGVSFDAGTRQFYGKLHTQLYDLGDWQDRELSVTAKAKVYYSSIPISELGL